MDPYLNIKPSPSPTFLYYNGTRQGPGFWGDPTTPMLLFPLALFFICMFILFPVIINYISNINIKNKSTKND